MTHPETHARLVAMAMEAKVPGNTFRDRMRYLVELAERNGLELVATQPRATVKALEHC